MGEAPAESGDEAALVQRYRKGDPAALEELLARHEGHLRARIRLRLPQRVRPRVSVEDIVQETRIALFESRGTFEPRGEGSFLRWTLGIAENCVRHAVRRHTVVARRAVGREVPREARPETGQFVGGGPTPSQEAVAAELEDLAKEAMETLSPEEREVLRLTREERLPLAEAAVRLGITPYGAGRLFNRALANFRETFDRLRGSRSDP